LIPKGVRRQDVTDPTMQPGVGGGVDIHGEGKVLSIKLHTKEGFVDYAKC